MISPQASVAARLRDLGVDEEIDFNTPPRPEMGDFSTPVALKLRKTRGGNPVAIAEELRAALSESLPPHIRDVRVTPPGFLNFFLDDRSYAADLLAEIAAGEGYGRGNPAPGKTLIEHTNVNPNKAMHVGHVRNAVLGDTLVRALRWAGKTVEACNYIDDTGVQVVDVVTALLYLEPPFYNGDGNFDAIWAKVDPSVPFDHFCWNLYAAVQDYLRKGAADAAGSPLSDSEKEWAAVLQQRKSEVMHGVEERGSAIAGFAKEFAERVVQTHLQTASRLNVYYNLMNWESDIIGRGFWNTTFDLLRSSGVIRYEESGLNKGCWVVPMGGIEETPDGPRSRDRILVRSNGLITYTAKDVAYQLWKFGRLDADFLFRLWGVQENGEELWTTSPEGTKDSRFGHASRVINVIDVGQSDPQTAVYECLERSGFPHEASCSIHLAYEKVMLSRSAAAELGVEIEEGQGLAMSGRKGLGVKASDLIDRM
ncbi:MAG: arginine--tRNA ligase, partial [Chloroflexi bacterium]|nr:arginine--tRNA ligase [Chloroflexota bacterium]